MFTIKEISELAVQIESNGEALYREVASKIADLDLKTLLELMAEDEARHGRWFGRLGDEPVKFAPPNQDADTELEAMGRVLLTQMLGEQTFSLDADSLKGAHTVAQVIEQAAEFEKDTIVFYEMLADFIEEASVAAHLQTIIAEERDHIVKLRNYSIG
jgi:rubrerythrin